MNETTNVISFVFSGVTDAGISGEYFAGIDDAIPNNIRTFTTVRSGNVNEGSVTGVYDQTGSWGWCSQWIIVDCGVRTHAYVQRE